MRWSLLCVFRSDQLWEKIQLRLGSWIWCAIVLKIIYIHMMNCAWIPTVINLENIPQISSCCSTLTMSLYSYLQIVSLQKTQRNHCTSKPTYGKTGRPLRQYWLTCLYGNSSKALSKGQLFGRDANTCKHKQTPQQHNCEPLWSSKLCLYTDPGMTEWVPCVVICHISSTAVQWYNKQC